MDKAEQDKARYVKQLKDFESLGYFYLEDGTKSTESNLKPKIKLGKRSKAPENTAVSNKRQKV